MRKHFLLFLAAFCSVVAVNAETITLEPGENKIETAIASAQAGDVIELTGDADNVYTEWHSITIDKAITLRAAEGATPVVHMPKIKMHAAFEVEGIEFYGFEDYLFITEVGGDFSISFRNCVLRDNPAYFIYICADQSVNALTIDNCIFKDNTKNEQPVVYGRGTIGNFEMRNSTVINCPGSYPVRIYSSESIIVDHCTFVNVGKQALRLAETTTTATTIAVSNCVIFSETATTDYAYYVYNGTLTNSVYFNSPTPGYRSGLTVNKIINANPQFIDPANGNLNFAFTSPLFLAATDGSNIGDPRWGVEAEDAIAVPGTLTKDDATLIGPKIEKNDNGIQWKDQDDPTLNSASWTIDVTKAGNYNVIVNVSANSTTTHNFNVSLYDKNGLVKTLDEPNATSGTGAMNCGAFTIATAGKYLVRLMNATQWSSATAENISMTYAGGGIVEIPGTLLPADAILSEKAFIDNDTIIFAPRDAEGYTPDGWAKWNVTLEESTLCSFKANCYRFSGNTMKIKISVIDADNDTIYRKEESVENSGNSEVSLGSALLEAGDYVIQMQNTVQYSKGRLMSVVVEGSPILVITDDSDIDFSDYAGQTVNVQLQRTFKANMYNPLCLPFAVSDALFQQKFKSPKSFTLSEASLENQKLFVKLAENYGIYQGTPVMVKPSEDVVNPIFENVEIKTANPSSTTKGPLCLRGSFARHELENKENILLVGANNTLFFPSDEHPYIKSMRAYFELKDVEPSQMPRFAAFIEPGNAPTEMIIVGGEAERQKGHRKVLVDGQIRIQHEGKCYSILGLER